MSGIHTDETIRASFVAKLLQRLALSVVPGRQCVQVDYPMMSAIGAYIGHERRRVGKLIAAAHEPGDVLIAHSFGCLASVYAMRQGAKFSTVFFFAAAAEVDVAMPAGAFTRLYNVYSRDDRALRLGARLPGHEFGELGLEGYAGAVPGVVNIPAHGIDHSGYVDGEHLERFAAWIDIVLAPFGDAAPGT